MRFEKVGVLGASAGALCAVWLLARLARPLLDATWFGMDRAGFLGRTAVLWLAMAVASFTLYVAWRIARVLIPSISDRPFGSGLSRTLPFLAILYPAMAAHFFILTVTAGEAPTARAQGISWLAPFHAYNIGLAAFWAAAGWIAASDSETPLNRLRKGSLVSAATLAIALFLLDVEMRDLTLMAMGMIETPKHYAVGGPWFASTMAYFAPIPTLLYGLLRRATPAAA